MVKSLLFGLASAIAICKMSAAEISPAFSFMPAKAAVKGRVAPADNQIWYGYYKGTEPISAFGIGMPDITSVDNAIFVNGQDPVCKGKKIVGLRFIIQGKGEISDISGWLSAELNIPVDQNLIVSVPVAEDDVVDAGWTEIMLPEPFQIPEEGVYAGYTVHTTGATHEAQFIGFTTNDRIAPDGALYNHESPFMSGWQAYGDRMGKLCYQVLLEGEMAQNSVTADGFGNHFVVTGESVKVPVALTNLGTAGINTFDYIVITDGVAGEEQHMSLEKGFDIFGGTLEVEFTLGADSRTAEASKEIVITKVNGAPNEAPEGENVSRGSLVTLASASPRKVVAETYTGTWCGWCPRAVVGNEKLREIYGESFIAIEAHVCMGSDVDPMMIAPYDDLKDDRRGYPTSVFNREIAGDPYTGQSREDVFDAPLCVDEVLGNVAEAGVTLTAVWANDDKTRISVSTEITFQYDAATSHYAMAYVLKCDGLSGEGEDWDQSNFFTFFAEDPEFAPGTELYSDFEYFLKEGEKISGMTYDDVAVGAYGLSSGLPESVVAPFVAGQPQTSEYMISIANNDLISDKSKLSVVAMLIDTESGRIVNADVCSMEGSDAIHGVTDSDDPKKEISRFDMLGRRLSSPEKGMNVVVYSDGSVKKVMVM